jgi:hypothetical protein
MNKNYHFIIFEQNDVFKNQTIEELLRERANYYISKNKLSDFWILLNPLFIKEPSFIDKLKQTNYCKKFKGSNLDFSVLVSTDIEFIKWIKLRIGFFEDLNDPLLKTDLTSNGVYFQLNFSDPIFKKSVLNHSFTAVSPNILVEQLQSVNV